MLELEFRHVDFRQTPEIATVLYNSFPYRTKQDLRHCTCACYPFVAAYHYGHLAGFVQVETHTSPPAWLSWLAVTKCFRRWRIATRLLEYVYNTYGSNELYVTQGNLPAIRCYEKFGYTKTNREVPYGWPAGNIYEIK